MVLYRHISFSESLVLFQNIRVPFFCLAIGFGIVSINLNALRWHILVSPFGTFRFTHIWYLSWVALFFNTYLPGGMVGDITKVTMLHHEAKFQSGISVLTDKLIGFLSLLFLSLAGLMVCKRSLFEIYIFIPFFLLSIAIIFLSLFIMAKPFRLKLTHLLNHLKRLRPLVHSVNDACDHYQKNHLLLAFSVSLFSQLWVISYFYALSIALTMSIPLISFFFFIPMVELISALPLSQGGLGIREAMMIALFSSKEILSSHILSLSLLSFLLLLFLGLMGGIIFLGHKVIRKMWIPKAQEQTS